MAVRKSKAAPRKKSKTTSDLLDQKVVAFAEQLGRAVGSVQARAGGWLDRKALVKEIGRIRDGAADLLRQVNRRGKAMRKATVKRKATSATRPGRGPVDAPGKRHRKPLPQERIDK